MLLCSPRWFGYGYRVFLPCCRLLLSGQKEAAHSGTLDDGMQASAVEVRRHVLADTCQGICVPVGVGGREGKEQEMLMTTKEFVEHDAIIL